MAVTFGAGGLVAVNAAGGVDSTTVLTDPVRVLDSRDPVNVGLPGPFESQSPQKLKVTGSIPTTTGTKTVVPTGATGVLLNVTAVAPEADGFISIRPGDATGLPTTSSLNVTVGGVLANAVLVALPTSGTNAGQIDITWDAYGFLEPRTDILIDVVGYTNNSTLAALQAAIDAKANSADVYSKAEIDASTANALRAAGTVSSLGPEQNGYTKIGSWTSSRLAPGTYSISFPGFRSCADPFPLVMFDANAAGFTAHWSGASTTCNTRDFSITVNTRTPAGALADSVFSFVILRDTVTGLSPLETGPSAYATCTWQPDAEPICE